MNTHQIEDRVRAAARAAADTVTPDSGRPLRLAPARTRPAALRRLGLPAPRPTPRA